MFLDAKKPRMTRPFWVSFCVTYTIAFLAIYGMISVPEGVFNAENSNEGMIAFKLSKIRVLFIALSMIVYPILLYTSLNWSKYFAIAVTAWAVAMYIDDHLVLYRIIEYPERGIVALLQAIRPILIISLLWMSFELTMKPSVNR